MFGQHLGQWGLVPGCVSMATLIFIIIIVI